MIRPSEHQTSKHSGLAKQNIEIIPGFQKKIIKKRGVSKMTHLVFLGLICTRTMCSEQSSAVKQLDIKENVVIQIQDLHKAVA